MGALHNRKARFLAPLSLSKTSVEAASSYTTVGSFPKLDIHWLGLINSTDVDILLSFDNGTTDHIRIPAGVSLNIDFASLGLFLDGLDDGTTATKIKYKKSAAADGNSTANIGLFELNMIGG